MKIAVLGCGGIGSLFLGYLTQKGVNIKGVVRQYQKDAFIEEGLIIQGVRGDYREKVSVDTQLKEEPDLAILSTKMDSVEEILKVNREFLEDSIILTTQNGIGAENLVRKILPQGKIFSGIVMFGATFYPPNRVVHNFEGELILGNFFNNNSPLEEVKAVLEKGFKVYILKNIRGAKFLKVFINLNNCLPACLGVSMQQTFSDLKVCCLAIRLLKEAYQVVKNSNIELESLPSYPRERVEGLVSMPESEAAKIFSQIMQNLSKEPLYGSILQSIKKGKKSEIDYINGSIVRLAKENNLKAPLNEKIVEMVHYVEERKEFLSKEKLLELLNYGTGG